jgi:hypothetical protein
VPARPVAAYLCRGSALPNSPIHGQGAALRASQRCDRPACGGQGSHLDLGSAMSVVVRTAAPAASSFACSHAFASGGASGSGEAAPLPHRRPGRAEQTGAGHTRPSRFAVAYGEPGATDPAPLPCRWTTAHGRLRSEPGEWREGLSCTQERRSRSACWRRKRRHRPARRLHRTKERCRAPCVPQASANDGQTGCPPGRVDQDGREPRIMR